MAGTIALLALSQISIADVNLPDSNNLQTTDPNNLTNLEDYLTFASLNNAELKAGFRNGRPL